MTVKLLIEQHLEFVSLKGGYTYLSESTIVKCLIVGNHMSRHIYVCQCEKKTLAHDFSLECVIKIYFSYFSTKTYVMGTQKNPLNETVLLSTQNIMLKLMGKKKLTILR